MSLSSFARFAGAVLVGLAIYVFILYRDIRSFKTDSRTKGPESETNLPLKSPATTLFARTAPSALDQPVDILGRVAGKVIVLTAKPRTPPVELLVLPTQPPPASVRESEKVVLPLPAPAAGSPPRAPGEEDAQRQEAVDRYRSSIENQMESEDDGPSPPQKNLEETLLKPYLEKIQKGELSEKDAVELRETINRQLNEE